MRWGIAGLLAALCACREPTEIRVELATDVACEGLSTRLMAGARAADTTGCAAPGDIGSIVLVPSGDLSDRVAVRVVAGTGGRAAADCEASGDFSACIVARRQLRYVPHARLDLPVKIEASCVGKPCDDATTCVAGACVSAVIQNPSDCANPGGCVLTADGGVDATVPDGAPPDATTPADAGVDAPIDAPLDVSTDGAVACPTKHLVSGIGSVVGLAADATELFWSEQTATAALSTVGFLTLANGARGSLQAQTSGPAGSVAVWASTVYWVETATAYAGGVGQLPMLLGPASADIAVGPNGAVYWVSGSNVTTTSSAGAPKVVATAKRGTLQLASLAADATSVYAIDTGGELDSYEIATGTPQITYLPTGGERVVVGAGLVVSSTNSTVGAQAAGRLGARSVLYSGVPADPVGALDIDAAHAYFATANQIHWVSLTTPGDHVHTPMAGVSALRVANGCLYAGTTTGDVWQLPLATP
jgi:hypothetical protein